MIMIVITIVMTTIVFIATKTPRACGGTGAGCTIPQARKTLLLLVPQGAERHQQRMALHLDWRGGHTQDQDAPILFFATFRNDDRSQRHIPVHA